MGLTVGPVTVMAALAMGVGMMVLSVLMFAGQARRRRKLFGPLPFRAGPILVQAIVTSLAGPGRC